MPDVVLLYDRSCPNVGAARANLMKAFARTDVPAEWREVDLGGADTPAEFAGYGSPTILVNGIDVAGAIASGGSSCRIYSSGGQLQGVPPVETIADHIRLTTDAKKAR